MYINLFFFPLNIPKKVNISLFYNTKNSSIKKTLINKY